jgi:hypothetical protein
MKDDAEQRDNAGEYADDQEKILKRWGADKLLEDNFNKRVSVEQIDANTEAQSHSGVHELLTPQSIDLKSELNPKEVVAATRLLFISERYDMPGFEHFVNNLLRLKVSLMRKGRREYIEGLHAEEKKEQGRDLTPIAALMRGIGGQ